MQLPLACDGIAMNIMSNQSLTPAIDEDWLEKERLEELRQYQIIDTEPEYDFDRITHLTTQIFEVPIACVTLVDSSRVFLKSKHGVELCELDRELAFCAHVVNTGAPLIVTDARADERFNRGMLVADAGIQFYAGLPLVTPNGLPLGTLCVLDTEPHSDFLQNRLTMLGELATLVMDRMEIRRAKLESRKFQRRFESLAGALGEGVVCVDHDNIVRFWNPGAQAIFGFREHEIIGRPFSTLLSRSTSVVFDRLLTDDLTVPGGTLLEASGRDRLGNVFPLEMCVSGWVEGGSFQIGIILRDITKRKAEEARIRYLADHDRLTGLANRSKLESGVTRELERSNCRSMQSCMLLIDLDNFKEINDTLGHAAGDKLLRMVAKRLKKLFRTYGRSRDIIARLGGDEFAIFAPDTTNMDDATKIADDVHAALKSSPFVVDNQSIFVDATIGIAGDTEPEISYKTLLANADLALYQAKRGGRGGNGTYSPTFKETIDRRRRIESDLHAACKESQFELFYQPQIRLSDGATVGVEALARWHHPAHGLLTPGAFIEILNACTLSECFANWVLDESCRQASHWNRLGENWRVGINLAPIQFQIGNIAGKIENAIHRYGIDPWQLECEITENIVLHNEEEATRELNALRELGVSIAFDDFGTGFASLSYLRKFPLDRLKIDRSFIGNIKQCTEDLSIVKSVIQLGHELNIDVIAEGIEHDEQAHILKAMGCDEVQGFLYGKPMPASKLLASSILPAHTKEMANT